MNKILSELDLPGSKLEVYYLPRSGKNEIQLPLLKDVTVESLKHPRDKMYSQF